MNESNERNGFRELDNSYMRSALLEAEKAVIAGEIPVGCIFVDTAYNKIICTGYNKTNEFRNGTKHAELVAMDDLFFNKGEDISTLHGSTLYVTCEPCIMCAAALSKVGIKQVFYGCSNDRFGGNGSILSVHTEGSSYSNYKSTSGLLKQEAINYFQKFYESENRRAPSSKRIKKNKLLSSQDVDQSIG